MSGVLPETASIATPATAPTVGIVETILFVAASRTASTEASSSAPYTRLLTESVAIVPARLAPSDTVPFTTAADVDGAAQGANNSVAARAALSTSDRPSTSKPL